MDENIGATPIGLDALNRALEIVSMSRLAREIGINWQNVQQWRGEHRRYATPAEYCPVIERLTEGRIRCEELRPDVDWATVRGTKRKAKEVA